MSSGAWWAAKVNSISFHLEAASSVIIPPPVASDLLLQSRCLTLPSEQIMWQSFDNYNVVADG
jgi:hypothetical protein